MKSANQFNPMRLIHGVTGACLLSAGLALQSQAADGSYTLFNPVPKDQMRTMVSDQAMFTLTPFTLDAGHFQWETDIADYFHDVDKSGGGNVKTTGWAFGRMTLKAGLCNRADLELSFWAYSEFTTRDRIAGTKTVGRGFSNLTLSSKMNLWGNDEGDSALAIFPYVTFPTTQVTPGYNDYTGGIQIPFSVKLPWEFRLGLITGFELYENGVNEIHPQFINGVSLRRTVTGNLNAYGEFFTAVDEDTGAWFGDINTGLAYQVTKDIEVNAGITFGVHNNIDYNPYIGISWRF